MPGSTARLAMPYPLAADSADVPRDVKAVADRVEALTAWIRTVDLQAGAVTEPVLAASLAARVIPQQVAVLPGAPNDGDRVLFATAAMEAAGVYWELRYVAARATNKWVVIGAVPLSKADTTAITNLGTSFTADPTVSLALPLPGLYMAQYGVTALSLTTAQFVMAAVSAAGAAPAAPADATLDRVAVQAANAITLMSVSGQSGPLLYTGAGNLVRLYNRATATGATPGVSSRWMSLIPIALGG